MGANMSDKNGSSNGSNEERLAELAERYGAAMHGVQTGIKILLETGDEFASPKHLRVGINSAMATDKGLANLLIAKGVFTEEEYVEAMAVAAEEELAFMTAEVRARLGNPNLNLA